MKRAWKWLGMSVTAVSLAFMAACGGSEETSQSQTGSSEVEASDGIDRTDWPEKFVYGILPTEDQGELTRQFEPMIEYMENRLGIEFELFVGNDYNALIEAMRNGHLHASGFGPFSYMLAHDRANAEAFAMGVEDEDSATYHSTFITLEDSGIESLDDLEGTTIAYADPASASGHIFPKGMVINHLGLTMDTVDDHFEYVTFSGSHEASLYSILNGDVLVAGVCDVCIERVYERVEDHPKFDKLKVIAESEPIPRGPQAINMDLPESLREAVITAFHEMKDDPNAKEFLEESGYSDYMPADDSMYDVIRETAEALEMSAEDLLQ
ncbi:phosphate/phosphite/phosphonate ABC transporter substrate-binding protein [Alkalihalophilus lindianensis]|uniref:Phosphate/phosphite/phosphonate ABC transporter substrate-binding protein n=1 Tax=Alkalihalophilus lindianensis TaxID=1630542 RepID=A0ABU3XD05_9BACI|nr:phosphate/phosphite/phosphonate ABC transporter substrate-binding protein [Alkalihalophilus lindianensis]MDV2685760.1 phosphate/phosphite/phosphonate ABC transporter substrate-binding protein [Alkalihalophilus lindianensis]